MFLKDRERKTDEWKLKLRGLHCKSGCSEKNQDGRGVRLWGRRGVRGSLRMRTVCESAFCRKLYSEHVKGSVCEGVGGCQGQDLVNKRLCGGKGWVEFMPMCFVGVGKERNGGVGRLGRR